MVIKSFFQWVLETGIIDKNSAALLKLPKSISNQAPVFLTLDQTRLLLKTAKLPGATLAGYGKAASVALISARKRPRSIPTLTDAFGSFPERRSRSMTVRPRVSSDTVSTSTR